jgi:hypothetical protein
VYWRNEGGRRGPLSHDANVTMAAAIPARPINRRIASPVPPKVGKNSPQRRRNAEKRKGNHPRRHTRHAFVKADLGSFSLRAFASLRLRGEGWLAYDW